MASLAAAAAEPLPKPRMVKDIRPGPEGWEPLEIVGLGDHVYFRADDGVHGPELWRSDGTGAGTKLAADIEVGPAGSSPEQLRVLGGKLIFAATTAELGKELWIFDPGSERAKLVKDIRPGAGSQSESLAVIGNVLYFGADDGRHGLEPWRSDGTREGTRMVADILGGSAGSRPASFQPLLGKELVFKSERHMQLYRSDGTESATRPFSKLKVYSDLYSAQDAVYFSAFEAEKHSLYRMDHSSGELMPILELPRLGMDAMEVLPGRLLIRTQDTESTWSLWVVHVPEGPRVQLVSSVPYAQFMGHRENELLLTVARDKMLGTDCWASDGTLRGTRRLEGLWQLSETLRWQDRWILSVNDRTGPEGRGQELHETDGTPQGARLILDIFEGPEGSSPSSLTAHQKGIFFTADDGKHGRELWVLDAPSTS